MPSFMEWLDPWYPVTDAGQGAGLEAELARELIPGHCLYGLAGPRLIARRTDTDDVLFALPDGRVAEVHLTWRQSPETDPNWPATAIFPSLETWHRESMRPLHREILGLDR